MLKLWGEPSQNRNILPSSREGCGSKRGILLMMMIMTFITFINRHSLPCYYLSTYGPAAFVDLVRLFSFLICTQSVGLHGREISRSHGHYLHTGQDEHRVNVHRYPCLRGIRTHDPSVRARQDGSCLRPRGYCDRRCTYKYVTSNKYMDNYLLTVIIERDSADKFDYRLIVLRTLACGSADGQVWGTLL
jgi:hypothetical protein